MKINVGDLLVVRGTGGMTGKGDYLSLVREISKDGKILGSMLKDSGAFRADKTEIEPKNLISVMPCYQVKA